ncbi:hypothetical protein DL96DRAFT_1576166 [Flagelloscypha sp. PMI_526]|nr:hypothetical protein DL96DRAFT_1576166 [Flagelloscypha sp. PMI_526]
MPSLDTVLEFKGYADIVCAGLLTVSPQLVYDNPIMRAVHAASGLQISNGVVREAAGFNQAIACMVAAIAVGQIVSVKIGPSSPLAFLSMYTTWGVLSLATCFTEMGSATILFSGVHHLGFAGYIWYLRAQTLKKKKGKKA